MTLRATLSLLLLVSCQASAFDFKGVPLGASEAEFIKLDKRIKCLKGGEDRQCYLATDTNALADYGPAKIDGYLADFSKGKLVNVYLSFENKLMSAMVVAMTAKFGAPTLVKPVTVKNRMNAVFKGNDYHWKRNGQTVRVLSFCSDVATGCVNIGTDDHVERSLVRINKEEKAAAGSM